MFLFTRTLSEFLPLGLSLAAAVAAHFIASLASDPPQFPVQPAEEWG